TAGSAWLRASSSWGYAPMPRWRSPSAAAWRTGAERSASRRASSSTAQTSGTLARARAAWRRASGSPLRACSTCGGREGRFGPAKRRRKKPSMRGFLLRLVYWLLYKEATSRPVAGRVDSGCPHTGLRRQPMSRERLALLVVAALSLGFAPAPFPRPQKNRTDLQKMQGLWNLVEERSEGQPRQPVRQLQVTIRGERLAFVVGGKEADTWTLALDPAKKPRTLDLKRENNTNWVLPGLYAVDGDSLTLAFNLFKVRPAEPSGKASMWMRFQRQKG